MWPEVSVRGVAAGGLEGLGVVDSAKTADITPDVPASVIYAEHS